MALPPAPIKRYARSRLYNIDSGRCVTIDFRAMATGYCVARDRKADLQSGDGERSISTKSPNS